MAGRGCRPSADKVIVDRGGKTIEIPRPAWFGELTDLDVDPAGTRLVLVGWNAGTFDSLGVAVVPVDGGTPVFWAAAAAERGSARFLGDGSVLFAPGTRPSRSCSTASPAPARMERLGKVPRSVAGITVSDDLKRAVVIESDYHGDAYMSRIVRP